LTNSGRAICPNPRLLLKSERLCAITKCIIEKGKFAAANGAEGVIAADPEPGTTRAGGRTRWETLSRGRGRL